MNRFDEVRNLTGTDRVMPNVTSDNPGDVVWIDLLRVSLSGFRHYCLLQSSCRRSLPRTLIPLDVLRADCATRRRFSAAPEDRQADVIASV